MSHDSSTHEAARDEVGIGGVAGYRAGFIGLIGRPNAGKSTLMNRLVGEDLAIVSPKPQTTRNRIRAIKTSGEAQYIYLDSPGIHLARGGLSSFMVGEAERVLDESDVVLFVVEAARVSARGDRRGRRGGKDGGKDGAREAGKEGAAGAVEEALKKLHPGNAAILKRLEQRAELPVVLVINKVDTVGDKKHLLPQIAAYQAAFSRPFAAIVPISARDGDGVAFVEQALRDALPESPRLFPEDELTDRPERFFVAEFIREQVLLLTHEEVPHHVAVLIEAFEESFRAAATTAEAGAGEPAGESEDEGGEGNEGNEGGEPYEEDEGDVPEGERGFVRISALVAVARDGQKAILIGRGGSMLKQIGTAARMRIEKFLGCRVHLELFVKVIPDWTEKQRSLAEFGYRPE